jgi:hypothetical protein
VGPRLRRGARALALDEALHDAGDVGVTLPGRLSRSAADAERAAALGLRGRVVKGQFGEADVHPARASSP